MLHRGEIRTASTLLDTTELHHTVIVKVTDGVLVRIVSDVYRLSNIANCKLK